MEQSAKSVGSDTQDGNESHIGLSAPVAEDDSNHSRKETREIVTPYAFQVAPELLGTPLATPMRRAMAQLLDVSFIYFISSANAMIFALVAAITFIKAGNNMAKKSTRSGVTQGLRVCGVTILAWLLFTIMDDDIPDAPDSQTGQNASAVAEPLLVGGTALMWQQCDSDMACLTSVATEFGENQADIGGTVTRIEEVFDSLTDNGQLDDAQVSALNTAMHDAFYAQQDKIKAEMEAGENEASSSVGEIQASLPAESDHKDSFLESLRQVIHDSKSLLSELGWGLGWAALYYSIFPASFKGYTPGKWLTGIRVLRLDGRSPSLWESFGRYGGYTAGFATGLLGFFQVFWDPNRQAIQDKIAETLVVRQRGPKMSASKLSKVKGTEGEGI